jgi:predicted RNA-binding Zn-ribbon protein involved in translation (DUF1610 family)
MHHYKNDPRPITVKWTGECAECNQVLRKGAAAYYWPATGTLLCPKCGEAEYNSFLASAFDEEVFNSMYPTSRF